MEGKYPIMIDGELCGVLEVTQKGAMTSFFARCRMREGILRLSVYGEDGEEGYLGVMMPEDGQLSLRRSLSPAAMRAFPREIVAAAPSGMGQAMFKTEPEEPEEEKSAPQDELYWYSSPDGALVSFDGERSLVALPVGDERIPGNISGQEREIEGKRYMVYAVKNERIQR